MHATFVDMPARIACVLPTNVSNREACKIRNTVQKIARDRERLTSSNTVLDGNEKLYVCSHQYLTITEIVYDDSYSQYYK